MTTIKEGLIAIYEMEKAITQIQQSIHILQTGLHTNRIVLLNQRKEAAQ